MRKRAFGRTPDGRAVDEVVLESGEAAVSILSLGSIVRDWRIDGPRGSLPVVLGFAGVDAYVRHARSHGALCGRVANRVAGARFCLDGQEYVLEANEGPHQLHGGPGGLGGLVWDMEPDGNAVELRLLSPDGDQGWPGGVAFSARWWLEGPRLICEMRGVPDRPTPINLANHNYYNLAGEGTVCDHVLRVAAARYTPTRPDLIPTGAIEPVEGTPCDFCEPHEIGDRVLDVNLVLNERPTDAPAAELECPRTATTLRLWTREPGLQLFDSFAMTIEAPGHEGQCYGPFAGVCLEAQHFPDSLHQPEWPSIVRTPEDPYHQRLEVEIVRDRDVEPA
jgi:aldose 1-epimerase